MDANTFKNIYANRFLPSLDWEKRKAIQAIVDAPTILQQPDLCRALGWPVNDSTMRKARGIVNEVRKLGMVVCSSEDGYWIPESEKDARVGVDERINGALGSIGGLLETCEAMLKSVGATDPRVELLRETLRLSGT